MINVAVTGLNACDSPAPGVPVIRCIKEHPNWGGRIIGLAYDALETGLLNPEIIDAGYLLPYVKDGHEALLARIKTIHQREKIDVIIPNLDTELPGFIAIRDTLANMGIKTMLPEADSFKKRMKANLPVFCENAEIKTPRTINIDNPSEIKISKDDLPIIVKGTYYEAYIATTLDEASYYVRNIASRWGYPVLIQKKIEGEEYNSVAIGDGSGRTIAIAAMKKIVLTDKHKGWTCISIENKALNNMTEKIISNLQWRGAIEIEAIYSKKEHAFYLIELNPRFPAWIYLSKAAGINLPYLYLQLALGIKPTKEDRHRAGVLFSNHTTNVVTDLSKIESLFTSGELRYEASI
ncbi:MAG: ATP-grasp domain-containing protein [Candidatus Poribacteria bacterium]